MFAAAGITSPPTTPDELLSDAKALTNSGHSGFCVRGDKSQTFVRRVPALELVHPVEQLGDRHLLRPELELPAGTEPQASAFGNFYRDLLTTAAPKGIATYLVTNCLSDFQQGRVAMWQDDSGSIPDVLDPNKSKVGNDVKFAVMPCQPANPEHCELIQPFGIWMTSASKHKGATWQLIQFMTSPQTQRPPSPRRHCLLHRDCRSRRIRRHRQVLPPTFVTSLSYILAHPDVQLLPGIDEGVAIIPPISDGLSNSDYLEHSGAADHGDDEAGRQCDHEVGWIPQAVPIELS